MLIFVFAIILFLSGIWLSNRFSFPFLCDFFIWLLTCSILLVSSFISRSPYFYDLDKSTDTIITFADNLYYQNDEEEKILSFSLKDKEESETFGDFIADTDQNIEEIAEQKELEELILQCLDNLTDKEKSVIKMRFGFNGEEPMTLEAVGNRLGVTRERIRQIEAKSIRKLRNYKTRLLLEDYIP